MPASTRSKKSSNKVSKKSARKVAKKATSKAGKKVARKTGKKVAKKAAGKTAGRTRSSQEKIAKVSPERRHEMIETAAYYHAVKRNFRDGDPVTDWLSGEKEIDGGLSKGKR